MMNNMFGFGFGGGLFMILWWGLIIAAIVVLVQWIISSSPRGETRPDSLEILKERYARGELSQEQFETMRREIGR
ncbi:MAG: SHOCT domain-containing protein [Hyphomicrobiales bacterium]|nr:SHOCT domain-containing protein [Hyphomicrobiales bacterium]